MYVINPAPASQDLQPTASSYVTAHRPDSPETIELQQQQHKEILTQILTKCNADMSEQVANFSCPDEKTPPRSTAAVIKEGAKHSTSPTSPVHPKASSPCTDEHGHGSKQTPEPSLTSKETSSSAPVGEGDTGRHGCAAADGNVRSPSATFKRSTSPDGSPLSTASSSNAASLSPASTDGPAKLPPKSEQLTESLAPASNFASVVHPKERALKSIAAAAASNERNNAAANGGSSSAAAAKTSTKFAGTGRSMLNGATSSFASGTTASTVGTGTASGGRLQFFKDGKFILELARAREGEKTSWISVPRKTYWPPTVSSTSANFHKHESSTSLSFSDDNSSIQSSPWQRDHCWKQSNPRSNISKELSLYYFRPLKARVRPPSQDTRLRWRRKRRRPYESSLPPEATQKVPTNRSIEPEIVENGKCETRKKETKPQADGNGEAVPESHSEMLNGTTTTPMDTSEPASASDDEERNGAHNPKQGTNGPAHDDRPQSNGHHLAPNGTYLRTSHRRKRPEGKDLISIIQTLIEQQQTKVSNSLTSPAAVGPFRLGTIAERGSNGGSSFRSSVFASTAASQHVSPRKRILRELEKVSLDDVGSSGTSSTKRSRPKAGSAAGTPVIVTATTATPLSTLTTNGSGSPLNGGSASTHSSSSSKPNGHLNGSGSIANGTGKQSMNGAGSSLSPASKTTPPAPAPVSKPFSSYSITSLLGHNSTSTSSGELSSSTNSGSSFDAVQRKTDASVASVTSTASHHHYHHSQHPLSPHHHQYQGLSVGSKSPVMVDSAHHHAHYQGPLGSNRYGGGYSTKKRSPSYGGGNGTAASPGATSGGSGSVDPYGNTIRSPDLSPSPEHHHTHQQHSHHSAHHHTPGSVSNSGGFARYRQHPYGGSPSSYSSAPSSSRFSPSPSTNDSATTPPYSGSGARSALTYRTAYQLGGNGSQGHSPPASASNGSPQHYSRASPLNFGQGAQHSSPPPQQQHSRNAAGTSSSPRASPNGSVTTSHATTPTSAMASLTTGVSPSGTIRTVPKKTAALRQPFAGSNSPSSSSPSRERSNSNASSSSIKKEPEGSDSVDGPTLSHYGSAPPSSPAGVIRPNTMIASPTAHHPVANPFYALYPTQLAAASTASPSMNPSVVAAAAAAAASSVPFHPASLSYYQHMYNAATMAFRTPLWMHYPGLPAPHAPHMVQSPHHLPPSSSAPLTIPLADRQRMADRSPPSPSSAPPASLAEATESQRLQHSILATPSTAAAATASAAAALNYSVSALSASSRDILNNVGSAFSSPSGSSWPTDAVGYQHHPDHSSRSSVSATAKDEPSNDVPLNLSKH